MGYRTEITESDFAINKSDANDALDAMRQACKNQTPYEELGLVVRPIYIPETDFVGSTDDLESVLAGIGIQMAEEDGVLRVWDFTGGNVGCEMYILAAIAPFVKKGSYINWEGEEPGDMYRFEFDGKKMIVMEAVISWKPVAREFD